MTFKKNFVNNDIFSNESLFYGMVMFLFSLEDI